MKISELQELLEKAKEEYGDVDILIKDCDSLQYFIPYDMESIWMGNGYGYGPAILVE